MTVLELAGAHARHSSDVRRFDLILAAAVTLLCVAGLGSVSIATAGHLQFGAPYVLRQGIALVMGAAIATVLAAVDYRRIALAAPLLYGLSLALLTAVLVAGPAINGAHAWLIVGPVQFQPSELAKVAVIVLLASLTHERREPALSTRGILEVLGAAALPMALILAQPDFGTFLVFGALVCVLLLVAGAHLRHLLALAALGSVALGLAWQLDLVEDYQIERLATFLDAEATDPQGAGYNTAQAQIAVGAGGLTGQGWMGGEQTGLGFVPEHHTDFIFTVIAERTGFVGAGVVLLLYATVLWRGLRIAANARDILGSLLAAGAVATIGVQVFISIGMTIGLVPVIGLPLPFVSYGGTSMIASLAMIGLLQSVHRSSR